MFADELCKEFIRDALATPGKYFNLFPQDQDIADRDERTWPVPSCYMLACKGIRAAENAPVVVLRDDIECTSYSRR